jgi:hypothetical protein
MFKIKAVGNYILDVRAVPFGGPNDLDLDNEYFSKDTDLHLDKFTDPLILYHHGLDVRGSQQAKPEIIGQALSHEVRPDGLWIKVQLDKANQYARRVWDAALQGIAAASSGSVAHLIRKAADGFIASWPLIELSLFDIDTAKRRMPTNKNAIALVSAKSLYAAAGRDFPDLDGETDDELRLRAIKALVDGKVDEILYNRDFERKPGETERLYEDAARGIMAHFGNTRKSVAVRFTPFIPTGYKGAKIGGIYTTDTKGNPRILLLERGDSKAEYMTFLHECGHALDHVFRGEDLVKTDNLKFTKAVSEGMANELRIQIGAKALFLAIQVFYGGKWPVKSVSVNKLLSVLKAIQA